VSRFPTTRGSVVEVLRSGEAPARERALATLAEAYWRPVYTYVRYRWRRTHEEAADLTQELFARLVEKGLLTRFDPEKARLRTYLRVVVDGLVANELKAAGRKKRGGGTPHVSLDFESVRREVEAAPPAAASPEQLFEREWVRSVFGLAVERLRLACAAAGRPVRFDLFAAYDLEADGGDAASRPTYEALARRFGLPVTDVTNNLAAARRDFRKGVLDVLRELTASDAEFRREARALVGVEPPA